MGNKKMDNTLSKLQEIFRNVFEDDEINLTLETSKDDLEDWDSSLTYILLKVELEKKFNIQVVVTDLIKINSISELIDFINEQKQK